ncbi:MAG: hypothetical protein INH41_05620 [Myxococcaceae bacterium]|jgi:hypothetical protein|nr:hypothetical protein [Myxococcaceae bacterium]
MRPFARALWLISGLLGVGCVVPLLVPSGVTVRSGGARDVAFAEGAGVRAWAHGEWAGRPFDLADALTPVHLTLENESGRAVRLAYEDVTLVGASGTRYAALPPFSIAASLSQEAVPPSPIALVDYHPAVPVPRAPPHGHGGPRPPPPVAPRIHAHRFHVAPPYAHFYFGFPFWSAWAWNAAYHARYASAWPRALPTEDMLQLALPEGALDDGGLVSGFLYFQRVRAEASVTLEVTLRDAISKEPLGVLRLPFTVQR